MRAARPDLGRDEVAELVSRADPAVDIGLARNAAIGLSGAALETLVGRAREDAELAEALLCRADLPPAHAAALYLSAAEAQRAEIRAGVETIATLRRSTLPLPAREACDALVDLAMAGDQERFSSRLAAVLGLGGTIEWGFGGKARHDLLPLALLAVGFGEEDAVRIILTLEPTIAFSVQEVFRLVRLFRQTPRPTAAYLIEAVLGGEARRPAARHLPHMQPGGTTSSRRSARSYAGPRRHAGPDATPAPSLTSGVIPAGTKRRAGANLKPRARHAGWPELAFGRPGRPVRAKAGALSPLPLREGQEVAARAVFDLHQPEIGIEPDLPLHAVLNLGSRRADENGCEKPLAAPLLDERLRRRAIEARAAVEAIDLHEDGARFRGAAAAQHGVDTLDRAAPQMGRDPEIGAQSARHRPAETANESYSIGDSGLGRELARGARVELARDRELALPLELLDGLARARADHAVALELAVAELRQRALGRR